VHGGRLRLNKRVQPGVHNCPAGEAKCTDTEATSRASVVRRWWTTAPVQDGTSCVAANDGECVTGAHNCGLRACAPTPSTTSRVSAVQATPCSPTAQRVPTKTNARRTRTTVTPWRPAPTPTAASRVSAAGGTWELAPMACAPQAWRTGAWQLAGAPRSRVRRHWRCPPAPSSLSEQSTWMLWHGIECGA